MRITTKSAIASQVETAIIDAITTLDWSTDYVRPLIRIIRDRLRISEEQAISVFVAFQLRGLIICKPERMAANLIETGTLARPLRARWFKTEELM